jgi:hypothetical protein
MGLQKLNFLIRTTFWALSIESILKALTADGQI